MNIIALILLNGFLHQLIRAIIIFFLLRVTSIIIIIII
eukprot:CAMPEP_0202694602 /NCGR_PEP_ID=MMETSP1385-20130828/8422_1 /ASSEMBLY_ACC=CAM_ASM_000861 /TAXON_ID=933848 /ORGANISM="Elphidium margaritaceum" /LENGTH=37 /DNA_ID= /DNA_START= /DNA_END= /DNA_ORIENTATION=